MAIFKATALLRRGRLWSTADTVVFPFISITTHGILILQLERGQEAMLLWPVYMNFYAVNASSCNVSDPLSSPGNIFSETLHTQCCPKPSTAQWL